jgi:DNA-binding Xre family transcriptional regulator
MERVNTPMDRCEVPARPPPARPPPRQSLILRTVFPQRLVRLRRERWMSQARLARASGLACSTIAAIEVGQTKNMMISTLLALCDALGVTPDYMLGVASDHVLADEADRHNHPRNEGTGG